MTRLADTPARAAFVGRAPLAATADPLSSHLAAAEVTASGCRDSQKREILEALRAQPNPCSSMELARAAGLDKHVVALRLPDLERAGLVERGPMRECGITGHAAITWRGKGVRESA